MSNKLKNIDKKPHILLFRWCYQYKKILIQIKLRYLLLKLILFTTLDMWWSKIESFISYYQQSKGILWKNL